MNDINFHEHGDICHCKNCKRSFWEDELVNDGSPCCDDDYKFGLYHEEEEEDE